MDNELEIVERFLNYKDGEFKEIKDKYEEALVKYNELKEDVISLLGDKYRKLIGEHLVKIERKKRYNADKIIRDYLPVNYDLSDKYYTEKTYLRITDDKDEIDSFDEDKDDMNNNILRVVEALSKVKKVKQ